MKKEKIANAIADIKPNPNGSGFQASIPSEDFILKLREGDSRCQFKLGTKVIKKTFEKGDIHQIGHKGIVTGSIYIKDMPDKSRDAYLVQFDLDSHECFTVGYKLDLDEN